MKQQKGCYWKPVYTYTHVHTHIYTNMHTHAHTCLLTLVDPRGRQWIGEENIKIITTYF